MDNLPKELLLEIFVYLPASDLLSLSLTCHKFNDVISNNSKLLENFEIQFISGYASNEWIGSRKYTKLFVDGSAGVYFLYILKQIGHEIEYLVVNCHEFSVAFLKQVLLMCENVKNLTIYNATNDSEPEDYICPFPKYNLKHFYFQGEIDVFKIFIECTTKSLDVRRDYDDESRDVSGLKNFLKAQKSLEDLKLENFDKNCSLFGDEILTVVDFKLKSLKLKNFDDHRGYNFWEFLEHHKETLVYLEGCFVNHEIMSPFRRFRNLKTLKLNNMCSDFSALNSIETLYLKDVGGKWSEKFKSVKNLVISQNVDEISQIENLKHLENLKISNCAVPMLKIPTVKRLTLKRVELESSKPFKYENGCQIDELKIIKCKNVEWLLEFLIHKTFNLKSLVIRKSILIDDDLKFIEDYRNKLKILEIVDCYGLTDEDIDNDEYSEDEDFSEDDEDEEEEEEEDEEEQDNEENSGEEEEESGSEEENIDSGHEEHSDHEERSENEETGSTEEDDNQQENCEEHKSRSHQKRPKNQQKTKNAEEKSVTEEKGSGSSEKLDNEPENSSKGQSDNRKDMPDNDE